MGLTTTYFFDTYALYEVIMENENFIPYLDSVIVTTTLNLMELHQALLREYDEHIADKYYYQLLPSAIDYSEDLFLEASKVRYELRDKKLSYVDCISYLLARQRSILFLTGDKEFEDMEGVKFVK